MKKILLLDVGGVLILSRRQEVFDKWASKLGKNTELVRRLIGNYNSVLARGKSYPVSDYLRDEKIDWINETTFEKFRKDLWDSEYLNTKLLSYILEHAKDYIFVLLTNNFKGVERLLNEKFKIPKFYKEIINSSEIGLLKPDPSIFLYTLNTLNLTPESCIFVDDKVENVNTAKSLNIKGIIYKDFASFKTELELLN